MSNTKSAKHFRIFTFRRAWVAITVLAALTCGRPAYAENCLRQAYGKDAVCTAEDISIATIEVVDLLDGCTSFGDTFRFNGVLHVVSHATERYDVGFYIGPNAYTSATANCTVTTIPAGGTVNDGDFCGDVASGAEISIPVSNVTANCADVDGDGLFDVSACSTWRQNTSNTDCPDEAHALPGTKSKCNCEPVNTNLPVPQCISGEECDDGLVCTDNICDPSAQGSDGFGCVFPFSSSATICRGSTGVCDPAENCTGTSGTCPTNTQSSSSTPCRPSTGGCDPAENCTGNSGGCPADSHSADGTTCTSDGKVCTDDVCAAGECTHTNNSDPCDDGLFCTTDDTCSDGTCTGTPRVCDDGKECSEDTCSELEQKCIFTECEPVIDGEICRTAGYWGTHGGFEAKRGATAVNVTQQLLDAVGPLDVCGEQISTTSNPTKPYLQGLGLTSALEGLCVRVQSVQQRSLYRALVAAALNCAVSGAANNCDLIIPEFSDCDLVCQGIAPQGAPTESECVALLDCFNNGGELIGGQCASGTCESQPLVNCGFDFPACPDFGGLPQPCVPFEDNCHDQELCNEDIGFCPGDTPSSSDAACREATSNNCTIDSCP